MNGHDNRRAVRQLKNLPTYFRNGDRTSEQAARRRRPQRQDQLWLHDRAFLIEPPPAEVDLIGARTLVQAALAALLVLEVLDRIGHEYFTAIDAGFFHRAVEHAAGGTDKRPPGKIFLISRLFADHQ